MASARPLLERALPIPWPDEWSVIVEGPANAGRGEVVCLYNGRMSRRMLFPIILILALAMPALAAAQATPEPPSAEAVCGRVAGTPVATPTAVDLSVGDLQALDFDLIFLDAMIPHLQASIDLATVARDRSQRPEVVEFASAIISGQQPQVDAMLAWRAEWYPDVPALSWLQLVDAMTMKLTENPGVGGVAGLEAMDPAHRVADVAGLCGSGDVDLAFIDALIAHNGSSIILAKAAVDRSTHRQIREIGGSLAMTQQFEIDQLLAWRNAWFAGTPIPDEHTDD
jgi:uncharacterized protein (DUF305 family)